MLHNSKNKRLKFSRLFLSLVDASPKCTHSYLILALVLI